MLHFLQTDGTWALFWFRTPEQLNGWLKNNYIVSIPLSDNTKGDSVHCFLVSNRNFLVLFHILQNNQELLALFVVNNNL